MMIQNKVREYCKEKKLIDYGDKLLLGLSGGADSVCLLFMLKNLQKEYGLALFAVHVNHGIRGEEALRMKNSVRSFAKGKRFLLGQYISMCQR